MERLDHRSTRPGHTRLRISPARQAWLKARWGVYTTARLAIYLRCHPNALFYWQRLLGLPKLKKGRPRMPCAERGPVSPKPGCGCRECRVRADRKNVRYMERYYQRHR